MPRFRARQAIYLSNEQRLVAAGEEFSSDETPGLAWIALDLPEPGATAQRTVPSTK